MRSLLETQKPWWKRRRNRLKIRFIIKKRHECNCHHEIARAYDSILRVARTIAGLKNSRKIKASHIAEAVQYRNLDREHLT